MSIIIGIVIGKEYVKCKIVIFIVINLLYRYYK